MGESRGERAEADVRVGQPELPLDRRGGNHLGCLQDDDLPDISKRCDLKRYIDILAAQTHVPEVFRSAVATSAQPCIDTARGRLAVAAERPGMRGR